MQSACPGQPARAENLQVQVLLVAEMIVDGSQIASGGTRDFPDADGMIPVVGKQGFSNIQHPFPG